MTRMIRCIEGHVFDIDAQDKCPQCGWAPAAKKEKVAQTQQTSPFAFVGSLFGTLIGAVDKLLGMIGLRDKPGLAAGIVYAVVILLFVGGASALTGAFRGGTTPTTAPNNVNLPPAKQEPQKAPPQQQQPQQQAQPPQPAPVEQGSPNSEPAGSPQQQQVAPYGPQRPRIQVPGEVKQFLRRIF